MQQDFSGIKAVFFDTSDTLYKNEALEKAYPNKLIELIATTRDISNDEAKQLLNETTEKLKATEKHVTKVRAAAEFGFSRSQVHEQAFCKVVPSDYLAKDEQLDAVMSKLAQRYKLGIISNLKKSHMLEVFEALGLSPEWFPLFVTEDIVQEIKPAAEPFLKAIELAQCAPDECLYVGDSPTKDMRPAKEVGMKTVLVAKDSTPDDLEYVDARIDDVKDVADLLGKGLKSKAEGEITIERAVPEDAEAVSELLRVTWMATYPNEEAGITEEDIRLRTEGENGERIPKNIDNWRKNIESQGDSRAVYVARLNNKVVGMAASGISADDGRRRIYAIYVLPEIQGKGVGSKLIQNALDWLGGEEDIYVLVASYNQNAIDFYKSFGFEPTDTPVVDEGEVYGNTRIPEIEMIRRTDNANH